jgi:hypothetical protein
MADGSATQSKAQGGDDALVFRLRNKKQLPVRAAEPVVGLLDPLRHRAGDSGCGEVSRDELVAALLVGAARASDQELRETIETYRQTRVGELSD